MKLHVFDIPNLLDNVLILDSDTSWGADVDFVYPNGSAVIHQFAEKRGQKECDGNDPVNFVNAMLARNDSVPLRSTGKACQIGWCSHNLPFWPPGVKAETADGFRHISHHMLFQRDIMMALHEHVKRIWRSTSIWGSVSRCWNAVDAGEHDKGGVAQRYRGFDVVSLYWDQPPIGGPTVTGFPRSVTGFPRSVTGFPRSAPPHTRRDLRWCPCLSDADRC